MVHAVAKKITCKKNRRTRSQVLLDACERQGQQRIVGVSARQGRRNIRRIHRPLKNRRPLRDIRRIKLRYQRTFYRLRRTIRLRKLAQRIDIWLEMHVGENRVSGRYLSRQCL